MAVPAFEFLDETIQRALWDMRWKELRPLQTDAIQAFFGSDQSMILAAATAAGKTEAAFLPILSDLAAKPPGAVGAVYIGPLKALINDQFRRLEDLCEHADIPVHRWHGDVSATMKKRFRKEPGGILLITPESLESNFINYGNQIGHIYAGLRHVVIDELHAFLGDVRGVHLRSLLARLELVTGRQPRVFGLSATLADFSQAQRFVDQEAPERVLVVRDEGADRDVRIGLRAYPRPNLNTGKEKKGPQANSARDLAIQLDRISDSRGSGGEIDVTPEESGEVGDVGDPQHSALAAELVRVFSGSTNLVFTNSRSLGELVADQIHQLATRERWPTNPFVLHHGSLAKEVRQDVEGRLKGGEALTVLCTSTLEMGIDIGSVRAVGQLGPPWSVASMVQRLGRSGRNEGEAAILRLYALEKPPVRDSSLEDLLCPELIRSIALVELMIEGWLEPADEENPHLSTLVHQVLSVLRQTGGTTAATLHDTICGRGAFQHVERPTFMDVLRSLGANDVIEQTPEGILILSPDGERVTHGQDFYAAFTGGDEFSVRHQGEPIGRLPADSIPPIGEHLVLNGRRWRVVDIEGRSRIVDVQNAKGLKGPVFLGSGGEIHGRVVRDMRSVLASDKFPAYLHRDASELLVSARKMFRVMGLHGSSLSVGASRTTFFPWVGTRALHTLSYCARADGIPHDLHRFTIIYRADQDTVRSHLAKVARAEFDPQELASLIPDPFKEKYDELLSDELVAAANVKRCVALEEAAVAARGI